MLVTPLGSNKSVSPPRARARSSETGYVVVTPLATKPVEGLAPPPSPTKATPSEETDSGSEDERKYEVTIRNQEGREYTLFASADGFAPVPEAVLAARLYGEDWVGSMTLRKDNGRGDLAGSWLHDRLVWELKPGSYVAHGIADKRAATRTSGPSDVSGTRRRGSVSQSVRSSGGSLGGSLARGCSLAGGVVHSKPTSRVQGRTALFGRSGGLGKSLSVRLGSRSEAKIGVEDGEETQSVQRGFGEVGPVEKTNVTDYNTCGVENFGESVEVRESEVARSVLNGTLRNSSNLRKTVEAFASRQELIPVVTHVPYPLDGDRIVVKNLQKSLLENAEDKGSHWGKGQTQKIRLENGESIRKYTCEGGFQCVSDRCWFVLENKVKNKKAFKRIGEKKRACIFCLNEAVSIGNPCEAEKYVLKGSREMLVVHVGEHCHELEELLDGEVVQNTKVSAILEGSASRKVS